VPQQLIACLPLLSADQPMMVWGVGLMWGVLWQPVRTATRFTVSSSDQSAAILSENPSQSAGLAGAKSVVAVHFVPKGTFKFKPTPHRESITVSLVWAFPPSLDAEGSGAQTAQTARADFMGL